MNTARLTIALSLTLATLAPSIWAAPNKQVNSSQIATGVSEQIAKAMQKPDLFVYGCWKKRLSSEGTPPNQVQIELNIAIENVGLKASKPSKLSLSFFLNNKTLTYDIPAIEGGSYGGVASELPPGSGNKVFTKNNIYHFKKVIIPFVDIGPLDLSNGIIADIRVDSTNTNTERQEGNNLTTCDFSTGQD